MQLSETQMVPEQGDVYLWGSLLPLWLDMLLSRELEDLRLILFLAKNTAVAGDDSHEE